jgi:hypothetical protein
MSGGFQSEIRFFGIQSPPGLARQPAGNRCVQRFFPTFEEQLLWVRDFTPLDELAGTLGQFP